MQSLRGRPATNRNTPLIHKTTKSRPVPPEAEAVSKLKQQIYFRTKTTMQDLRQSKEFAHYMEKINWRVGKEKNFQFYVRCLPVLGNFIKIPRPPKSINSRTINALAKKHHAFAVKVDYSPTKTLILDLKPKLEEILAQTKKDCRYEIKKAQKNQVVIKKLEDIETFIKIWHRNALRRGFWIPFGKEIRNIYEAFGKNSYLLLAHQSPITNHQSPISGALILIHDKVAYYFHAASTLEGRKLSAPYLVVWEAIKLAKKKGCEIFDFEGIYDERFPIKSWKGFTHFKKSFGGYEVKYPAPLIEFYSPILTFIARLRREV